VQDVADAIDSGRTGRPVANVTFDEAEVRPICIGKQALQFIEVSPVPRREIVEADDPPA
jgi:hypothetical protein